MNGVTPWSPVGYLVQKRTYSRRLVEDDPDSPTEEWIDVCNRVVGACRTQLNVGFTADEEARLFDYMLTLKGSVAGRFLWQLGTSTVDKLGLPSLQNCFSGNTKILTQNGTRALKDLAESSASFKVWAYGEWHNAYARHFGTQPLNRVVFKKPGRSTYRFQTEVTGNHRWELLDGTVTDALKVGDRVTREAIQTEHDQKAFVHGLVFGDGSLSYRYSNGDYSFSVRLCGAKAKYKDLFDKYSYQPNCDGDPVAYIRSTVNLKDLPNDLHSPDYIGSFVRGWCAADGSITPSNTVVLSTQNEAAVQWLHENAAYAGMSVTGSTVYAGDTNYGPRTNPLVKVSLSTAPQFLEVEEIHPLGEDAVYCAVVEGVERFTLSNGLLTCNCAFVTVDHPVRPFTWAFDMLMLGSGVGYNIQREYVYKLPPVREGYRKPWRCDTAGADFIVPDSREGWVYLLERCLSSAFSAEQRDGFSYSTQLVRGKGAPIRGFGGVASGPEDLCRGIDLIGGILEERAGKQLRPIDCLDIMNILGMVVVSGNVRRSAQIALGDFDDIQYLRAKDWSSGNIPNWRAYSNNSVVCNDVSLLPQAFWDTYNGKSEPYGLINLKLSQSCGRLGETQYKDKAVRGFNPCAEQSLADYETCCLAEVFLPNVENREEFLDIAKLLYRVNKHSLSLGCHHKETESIVHKHMRMGIGITGILQCPDKLEWCDYVYKELRKFDKEYSKQHGWPASIKLTTTKPSGTLSLLPGVTAGVHPALAQYMIRRIRIASNNPLVETCKQHGYPVEYQQNFDGTLDYSTVVVEFPFSYPEGTVLAEDLTAIDQLEWVKKVQTVWSDNAVSCTVYYTHDELPKIKEYLSREYNQSFKSLSFLLREGHGFVQAPIEPISKEEYERRVASTRLIASINSAADFGGVDDCVSGACPVR